ncbi:MAG: hypothetical protein A2X05_01155 [Bacteroidetes bacterium GWE2_41_25]|nr:MAG: hypothetical protein A2X05_01155 [Bacteroidetes bacterium GWE2_41_25]
MVKLSEVCEIKSGGTPPTNKVNYYKDGKIPWLKSEVCKDEIVNQAKSFISDEGLKNSSAKWLNKNSTLIALVGATIGKTAFITFEATTNQNIAGLYPKNLSRLDPFYLYMVCQTLYEKFIKLGDGGFRMANLTFVKNLNIPIPKFEIQKKLVAEAEKEQQIINANKQLIEIYEQKISDVLSEI